MLIGLFMMYRANRRLPLNGSDSGNDLTDHFVGVNKMVTLGSGAIRENQACDQ